MQPNWLPFSGMISLCHLALQWIPNCYQGLSRSRRPRCGLEHLILVGIYIYLDILLHIYVINL